MLFRSGLIVPLMVLLVAMTQSFATKNVNASGGTVKSDEFATVEGLIGIDCPNAVVLNSGLVAGERMNLESVVLTSSKKALEDGNNYAATVEGLIEVIAQNVASDVVLVEKYTADIKTDARGGAGIMPEETFLATEGKNAGIKYQAERSNCNCATCITMAKNTLVSMGGNSA